MLFWYLPPLLLLAEVELLKLFLGELLDPGGGDEPVLVLGRDELQVLEVWRRPPLGLGVLAQPEPGLHLQHRDVLERNDGGGHGNHDGLALAVVPDVVDRRNTQPIIK